MNEEYHSLLANDTWDLVPLPKGQKFVRCKWVYRTHFGPYGKVDKYKAHLVAKVFSQVEGIDYIETFSPVSKKNPICLVLSLVASFKWEVHQMDVKSTFLHGDVHEEIYMEQPPGFIQIDSSLVCRLKKSLYGLKQGPELVLQSKEGISLSQSKYSFDLLCHFHMEDCKPTPSPFHYGAKLSVTCTSTEVDATLNRHFIRKNWYLTHTHPNLSFVVGLIAQFMQNPHESHWKVVKRIFRYVRGTIQFWIHYSAEAPPLSVGFTDSDWVSDRDDQKSTVGYVFTLGSGPITWACKKQSFISLSSVEVEYCGALEASKESMWLRQILLEFGFQQQHLTTLWCDNQSAIQLCQDPV
eukprot:PITA_34011